MNLSKGLRNVLIMQAVATAFLGFMLVKAIVGKSHSLENGDQRIAVQQVGARGTELAIFPSRGAE